MLHLCFLQVHFVGFIYVCKICYTFWVCVYNMLGSCFLFLTVMVSVVCKKCVMHSQVISLGSLYLQGTELLSNLWLPRAEC